MVGGKTWELKLFPEIGMAQHVEAVHVPKVISPANVPVLQESATSLPKSNLISPKSANVPLLQESASKLPKSTVPVINKSATELSFVQKHSEEAYASHPPANFNVKEIRNGLPTFCTVKWAVEGGHCPPILAQCPTS